MLFSSSSRMYAIEAKDQGKGAKKKQPNSQSSWGAMALKNRGQPGGGGGGGESKNSSSSSKKKKKKTTRTMSICRGMTCAASICSTKESSVLSRGSRRSSGGGGSGRSTSSRSLKAPDSDAVPATAAAVSASSSFNSETTVTTTTTTISVDSSSSTLSSSALSSPLSSIGGSRSFRKLSGCYYECHSAALDPKTSLSGGTAMLSCADCDEFFTMAESLELHRATKHAVSELGADDTSRNVVEIIFQSSWLIKKPKAPVCRIERILKVQSSRKTVEMFEQYRERVKARAASRDDEARRSYPRCAADGNELLRFQCTTFRCSLGLARATALCRSSPRCKLCSIIRDGFRADVGDGKIATMATSVRAHATAPPPDSGEKRAMLVCRVVAGRVKKVVHGRNSSEDECDCDSVCSCSEGVYSDLDELFVFNPRAILPCFVVIYSCN